MYPTEPLYIDGLAPIKAHEDDAAFDLRCAEVVPTVIQHGQADYIGCGVAMAIPEGYVGLICSRSGLAMRRSIFVLNAPGVIDPGYRGDIGVILMNLGGAPYIVSPGDRIAQLLILPNSNFRLIQTEKLPQPASERGAGGFGSTGLKDVGSPAEVIGLSLGRSESLNVNRRVDL